MSVLSLKQRLETALRSATNRGLRRVSTIILIGYGLLLAGVVFVSFQYELTPTKLTTIFERIPEDEVPALASDLSLERDMIDSMQAGEIPVPKSWESVRRGYPVLYAYPMAELHTSFGNRGLAIFNVLCTLLAMLLVERIGIRIWIIHGAAEGKMAASAEGKFDDIIGTQTEEQATHGTGPQDMPVTATFFGLVAMCIFGLNPIVFDEAIRPGPRPFAYLLGTLALGLSLRVLVRQAMPSIRCGLLIVASGFVHLPALLTSFPVLLFGWLGGLVQIQERKTTMQRFRAKSRKALIALIVAAVASVAWRVLSKFGPIDESLTGFVDQYVPTFMKTAAAAVVSYVNEVVATMGSYLVAYAPQLAVLSLVPLPSMKGIVERTMLAYAAGLLAFFTLIFPGGDVAQLYPAMVPTAILGAIGIVNVVDQYLKDALDQLSKLWVKFFATLGTMPAMGWAMGWASADPVDELQRFGKQNLALNGLVTPYSALIVSVAILGLLWQFIKLRRRRLNSVSE